MLPQHSQIAPQASSAPAWAVLGLPGAGIPLSLKTAPSHCPLNSTSMLTSGPMHTNKASSQPAHRHATPPSCSSYNWENTFLS